jgi:hypothetical protein
MEEGVMNQETQWPKNWGMGDKEMNNPERLIDSTADT